MSEEEASEKNHEATPQKLEQARKKGELPKSTDINAAASYLGLLLAVWVFGAPMMDRLANTVVQLISSADRLSRRGVDVNGSNISGLLLNEVLSTTFVFFGIPAMLVLTALSVQRVWVFAPEKLTPKLTKISPLSGAKNKFGANGWFEFGKSVFKLVVVSVILVWFSIKHFDLMLSSTAFSVRKNLMVMNDLVSEFLLLIFALALLVGGVDYLWQLSSHLRKNRMSRKEVEDESKANEGDPHQKQLRRQRGYEIAMNQMLAEVPNADVILVNPTHFSVALKWSRESTGAPVCVAKGVDEIAAKIREIAQASLIPIHSDPPTARAIFSSVEIGQQILPEHYRAVAVAIRYSESIRQKAKKA